MNSSMLTTIVSETDLESKMFILMSLRLCALSVRVLLPYRSSGGSPTSVVSFDKRTAINHLIGSRRAHDKFGSIIMHYRRA